ncbi:hypothetical protein HPC49_52315 [Pyxidicoccus fallax]|uniref:Lipoprotein n=1 Tax=Pyxidicoccus fallax TaxID=394095 RepID=A0A848M099_9BACT|nr:hypothetical protein [Pyxidicoccus fallax]NMO23192.1 hypothetical protein [Pyxidicoccus fallax]NPC86758.1 hypothetical protein [Pyxidicoccus fallax]
MIRSFWVLGAMLFLACTSVPEGLCEGDQGCLPGLRCQEGVCVGCGGDGDCHGWEACSASRRCELRAGMCATSAHCKPWEVCGAGHTCELSASACQSSTDCEAHETCSTTSRTCVPQPGRCNTAAHCGGGAFWTPTCGEDNWCQAAPAAGDDVLIWGTLSEGSCGHDAISSVMTPTKAEVGFKCYTDTAFNEAILSPGGLVHYVDGDSDPHRLKVFVPDRFKVDGERRSYPQNGPDNDIVISTPACGNEDVSDFIMQGGTGAVAYTCDNVGGYTYYDIEGQVVSSEHQVHAWNGGDYMLAYGIGLGLVVLSPEREPTKVTGLPNDYSFIDARARSATGFWLAIRRITADTEELWYVRNDGVATREGTYGAFPALAHSTGGGVLDSAGALFAESSRKDEVFADIVVKRPADGTTGTIVYDESTAPEKANGASNYTDLFNFMHISYLFSGP